MPALLLPDGLYSRLPLQPVRPTAEQGNAAAVAFKKPASDDLKEALHAFWTRQAKRKARTYPELLVVETMISTGLSALEFLVGKREVARRLALVAAQVAKEADVEEALRPPSSKAIN